MSSQYSNIAFISYKREDEKWAKWLQKKLEHYKLPTEILQHKPQLEFSEHPRHVFKDTTDLSGGGLAKAIKEGLDSSKFLIVICSPRAAKSEWVCREVQDFIDSGREEYIIPFIIDGEPYAKNQEKECFPFALRALAGEKELLGISIKENGRDAAVVKVISHMFDITFDSLWQRHKRMARRQLFMVISLLIIFISLLLSSYILYKKFLAKKKETSELTQSNEELVSLKEYSQAELLVQNGLPLSASHALVNMIKKKYFGQKGNVYDISDMILDCTDQLINSRLELISVTMAENNASEQLHEEGEDRVLLSVDCFNKILSNSSNCAIVLDSLSGAINYYLRNTEGKTVLNVGSIFDYPDISKCKYLPSKGYFYLPPKHDSMDDDPYVRIYDLKTGEIVKNVEVEGSWYGEGYVTSVSNDGSSFLYHYGYRGQEGIIEYQSSGGLKEIFRVSGDEYPVIDASYSPSGDYILLTVESPEEQGQKYSQISIIDARTYSVEYSLNDLDSLKVGHVSWSEDENDDFICLDDISDSLQTISYKWKFHHCLKTIPQNNQIIATSISNDGSLVAYSTTEDLLYFYDTEESKIIRQYHDSAYSINFSNKSNILCAVDTYGQTARFYHPRYKEPIARLPIDMGYNSHIKTGIAFSSKDDLVVFECNAPWGGYHVWNVQQGNEIEVFDSDSARFSDNFSRLVLFDEDILKAVDLSTMTQQTIDKEKVTDLYPFKYDGPVILSNNKEYYVKVNKDQSIKYGKNPSVDLFLSIYKVLLDPSNNR